MVFRFLNQNEMGFGGGFQSEFDLDGVLLPFADQR